MPRGRLARTIQAFGPGLITGAADDDPSGIATYSQTGAQFGYGQLWTALFVLPLQTAVQEACARIGAVTGRGIAAVVCEHYSRPVLFAMVGLVLVANTINIGADIGAMAAAANLLLPVPLVVLTLGFTASILVVEIFSSYPAYSRLLKWLVLSLLAYPLTVVIVGATWAIIVVAATVLHANGLTNVASAADAARALEPLVSSFPNAGFLAKAIFAAGILGLGYMAIPILSCSAAYALAETFGWHGGLARKLREAHGFYEVITVATLLGLAINTVGIDPIQALIYTAVINGVVAVPLLFLIARIAERRDIMGEFASGRLSRTLVWLTFIAMGASVLAMFGTLGRS